MRHTAPPGSLLAEFCEVVVNMEEGQCWRVPYRDLRAINGYEHNGAFFGPADRVLGNIVGSAYTHSYTTDTLTGDVIFRRHKKTGQVYYRDPDRR